MKMLKTFGNKIRAYRKKNGETITQAANTMGIGRSYLSKLEHSHEQPSQKVLSDLISHYSLSRVEAIRLSSLAGYEGGVVAANPIQRKEVFKMTKKQIPEKKDFKEVKVPDNIQVLYSDSVFVTSSQWGIVFDFAQNVGPTNRQNVVARIGMSKEHARALMNVIQKRLAAPESQKSRREIVN